MDLAARFPDLPWLPARTIYLTRHGSHAYGLARPTSDLDLRGAAVPPRAYLLGFSHRFEQAEARGGPSGEDIVVFELRKLMALAAECNPSVIEILWTAPEDQLIVTPAAEKLLDARAAFLSKKARHTFSGYAVAQLKRIQTHHRWLLEPPKGAPTRADFALPERTVIPKDQLMAAEAAVKKQVEAWDLDLEPLDEAGKIALRARLVGVLAEMSSVEHLAGRALGLDENFLLLLDRERAYRARQREWEQYQEWKQRRNPDRAALEARFGYDTKHALHLVRLLRMCREILETGQVIVKRPDRDELLAIRDGGWSYDRLIAWAEEQDRTLDEVARRSPLPPAPDRPRLDALCVDIVGGMLG